MTNQPILSSEFSSLASQLQQCPDDQHLKQIVVSRLPEMRALAKVNPLAMFHLAQIYAPTSPQYKQMMRQSANLGCTNAMLALCELMVHSTTDADIKTAAHYLSLIERSNDSYIMQKAQELMDANPDFTIAVRAYEALPHQGLRFFTGPVVKILEEELEMNQVATLNR